MVNRRREASAKSVDNFRLWITSTPVGFGG